MIWVRIDLRVQRRGLEAELMNVGKERTVQLLAGCWDIQTALPLLIRHNFCIAWRSFRPLRQTYAQPAHAALAADAGGTRAEGVERDGSDDQGQVQGQVYCPRYVHVHHEGVLHSDDAAVQDGGRDRWDLQHFATPGLGFARGQGLSPQVGHQLLDLLHLPFGIESLSLVDGCLWHHHAG